MMEDRSINSYKRYSISVVVILLAALMGYEVYNSLVFRVVGVNPNTNNVSTATPFFKIKFNKNLEANSIRLSSSPNAIRTYSVDKNILNITLEQPLVNAKTYTIDLGQIKSGDGKMINNHVFTFTARYVPFNKLPLDQKEALNNQQQQYNQIVENGLPKVLPFTSGGLEFKVGYNVQYKQGLPVVQIIITAPNTSGQQAALSWIKSLGFDPLKYQISYVTSKVTP